MNMDDEQVRKAMADKEAAERHRDAVAERNMHMPVPNNAGAEEVAAWNGRQREWEQARDAAEAAAARVWDARNNAREAA